MCIDCEEHALLRKTLESQGIVIDGMVAAALAEGGELLDDSNIICPIGETGLLFIQGFDLPKKPQNRQQ